MQCGFQRPTVLVHLLSLASGQRSNERIKERVLMPFDPFTAECHVAIFNTAKHSVPHGFVCYSIFRLCHCVQKISIQSCRYKHCLVVMCCGQLYCNVPCVQRVDPCVLIFTSLRNLIAQPKIVGPTQRALAGVSCGCMGRPYEINRYFTRHNM